MYCDVAFSKEENKILVTQLYVNTTRNNDVYIYRIISFIYLFRQNQYVKLYLYAISCNSF